MPSTSMWAYTWDLCYASADDAIGHLKNHVGLQAISVATSYHTYEMLCAQRKGSKFVLASESAVYFRPHMAFYDDTPIKPHLSPMVQDTDPLKQIGDACLKYGLTLASWTVCLHNSYLATNYPDHAQVSAFGDVMKHVLCASSPAVQAYMVALARDLTTNYPVQIMELESLNFQGHMQGHYHEKVGIPPGPVESCLFSLCFCEHCKKQTKERGLDFDRLRNTVQAKLDLFCEVGVQDDQSLEEYVASNVEMAAFIDLRADTVTSFTRKMVESVDVPIYYYLMGDYYVGGMRYKEIAEIVDRVVILGYTPSPDQLRNRIVQLKEDGVPPEKVVVGLQAYPPASPDEATLIRTTQAAAEQHVAGYCYYNYGIMPKKNLVWVGKAIGGW